MGRRSGCGPVGFRPRAWLGMQSSIHIHVWAAIFLGRGALACFPIILVMTQPGSVLTRQVIAVAQMLWSALLIHIMGGRLETHFHVFVSLAFLACYRRPSVLLTATIVLAIDHVLRGLWWPMSIYGLPVVSFLENVRTRVLGDIRRPGALVFHSLQSFGHATHCQTSLTRRRLRRETVEEEIEMRTRELRLEIEQRKLIEVELVERDEQLRQSHKLEAVGSLAGGIAPRIQQLIAGHLRNIPSTPWKVCPVEDQRHQDLEQVLKAADRANNADSRLVGFQPSSDAGAGSSLILASLSRTW